MLYVPPPDMSNYCCRCGLQGRGEVGEGPVQGVQQAHQASTEHDPEGRGRLWTGFHTTHQRGTYFKVQSHLP